jgi:hypothetical protein
MQHSVTWYESTAEGNQLLRPALACVQGTNRLPNSVDVVDVVTGTAWYGSRSAVDLLQRVVYIYEKCLVRDSHARFCKIYTRSMHAVSL